MRTRFKPYARPELSAWSCYIVQPHQLAGSWNAHYVNPALPFRVELGCGKGAFLAALSLAQPAHNYLGIDIKSEMLVVAKRTIEERYKLLNKSIDNIFITSLNIEKIGEILLPADRGDRVYINFCNPWHKSGHAKHRLTHPRQLLQIRDFLLPGREIWFKTDDDRLFRDSLRYFELVGFELVWSATDLHACEPAWNIRTEHENMFSERKIPIKACIARKTSMENIDREAIMRMKDI